MCEHTRSYTKFDATEFQLVHCESAILLKIGINNMATVYVYTCMRASVESESVHPCKYMTKFNGKNK